MERIKNFFKDESGASAVEYGLLVALIAVVIITAVTLWDQPQRLSDDNCLMVATLGPGGCADAACYRLG